jgi:hypothetical protein
MRPLAVSLNVIFVRRSDDDRCQLFSTIARSCIGHVTLPPRTGGAEKTPALKSILRRLGVRCRQSRPGRHFGDP